MRTYVKYNLCIGCSNIFIFAFFYKRFAFLLQVDHYVNQTFNFFVLNLCLSLVQKVGLIAISLISLENANLRIYKRVRCISYSRTIRDLMQFSTFTTNFRNVMCDLCVRRFDLLSDCISASSHTRTVVRECFKGEEACQWKRPKFDFSPHKNFL